MALEVEIDVLLVYVDVALEVETDVLLVAEDVTLAVNVDVPLSDIDVLPALDAEEAVLPCQVEELAVEEAVVVVLELVNDEVIVVVLVVVSTGAMPSIPTDTSRSAGTVKSVNCSLRRTMLLFPDSM